MSLARDNFLERIETVQDALHQPLLVDAVLTDTDHNRRARILRNGLMVVAFSALEDFIRERCNELLAFVSRTTLKFNELPRDLVLAATVEVMRAAYAHSRMASRQGDDPVLLLQQAASEVASTVNGPLSLSRFSLGHGGANVTADEVGDILKTLHVADAWNEVTALGQRVGLAAGPLKDSYAQGLRLRNRAAHRADSNVQPSELASFCQVAKAIALGFDLLASRASRLIHDSASTYSQTQRERLAARIGMVVVNSEGRKHSCRREGSKRALRIFVKGEEAWRYAVSVARARHEAVVELDKRGVPRRWASTDCP